MEQKLPKRGDQVLIKKGARIESTHPQIEGVALAKRSYFVQIHDAYEGYTVDGEAHPSRVTWAGSGGYWKWCPLGDVEVVKKNV